MESSPVTQTGVPLGGTELILANLTTALPELTDQVQIIMSRPESVELDPNKPRILWLQDLPHDPASAKLADPSFRTNFNRIVFASFWQQQQYNLILGVPYHEGVVIKNGVPRLTPTFPKPKYDGKIRFIYTSTPHRGLNVLAASVDVLAKKRQDWELHVYSSLNIYGWHTQDVQFTPLYDQLRANPCVTYHGSQSNATVRQAALDAHVWVYPSTYQETSCMAAQEALMAGCLGITSSFGALIETCGEWAWMMPFTENLDQLASMTHMNMVQAIDNYDKESLQRVIQAQSQYFQNFYAFERRLPAWEQLLTDVINEGVPTEQIIL